MSLSGHDRAIEQRFKLNPCSKSRQSNHLRNRSHPITRVAASQGDRSPLDDPDLAAVVAAWPGLPEPIRAGIVAMVKAASK